MQMTIGRFVFAPHLILSLMVAILLPILLSLSYWQWQRAHDKQSMLDAFALSQTQMPVSLVDTPLDKINPYQAVEVTGRFLPEPIFLLDNQIYEGRAGFDVLMVFRLNLCKDSPVILNSKVCARKDDILVNLGWIPRHTERKNLPFLPPLPQGKITLKGRAYFPSHRALLLGTNLEHIGNKIIIQKIDFEQINTTLSANILPIVILAAPDSNSPLIRDWQPANNISPATHYGYAVQWLLLAITLCVLYLIFSIKRKTS